MATAAARKTAQTAEQLQEAGNVSVYLVCTPLRWGTAPDDALYQVDDEMELTAGEVASLPPGHVKLKPAS